MKKIASSLMIAAFLALTGCSGTSSTADENDGALASSESAEETADGLYTYEEPQLKLKLEIDGTTWNMHSVVLGDESFDNGTINGQELMGAYEGYPFVLGKLGSGHIDITFAERQVRLVKD